MQEAVTIENAREMRRLLTKLAPEAKKALDKANREAAAPLLALARSNFVDSPMANWGKWTDKRGRDLSYDVAAVRKGIKVKAGKRSRTSPWSALTQIQNTTAAGAIYEMAGRKTNNTQFTRNLQGLFPVSVNGLSRGIWKAIKEYPIRKYQDKVVENYDDATKVLQRSLDGLKNG
jgi:hypothetical protein